MNYRYVTGQFSLYGARMQSIYSDTSAYQKEIMLVAEDMLKMLICSKVKFLNMLQCSK